MLIPSDEVNILNTFRVKIILRLLLLLTNLHLKLLSTQGTGADKLLSTQRVKNGVSYSDFMLVSNSTLNLINLSNEVCRSDIVYSLLCKKCVRIIISRMILSLF